MVKCKGDTFYGSHCIIVERHTFSPVLAQCRAFAEVASSGSVQQEIGVGTGRTRTQGDLGTCLSRAVGTAPRASDVEKTVGGALDRGHPCRVRLQVGRKEKWYDILEKITPCWDAGACIRSGKADATCTADKGWRRASKLNTAVCQI